MYVFCEDFYLNIVKEMSVREAFEKVCENLSPAKIVDDERFQSFFDVIQRDHHMKPLLLPRDEKHDQKIFDPNDPRIDQRPKYGENLLVDTSMQRGYTNVTIKKYPNGYTGMNK